MNCPRCSTPMQEETLTDRLARAVTVDICHQCHGFWFDAHESVSLAPASTLTLFRIIGANASRAIVPGDSVAACPRCGDRLQPTHDLQRATRFQYLACPARHGRFISFFEFLREKEFVKPLSPRQVSLLREQVQAVNCSNCGAPVTVEVGGTCASCASPLSMLDLEHARRLLAELRDTTAATREPTMVRGTPAARAVPSAPSAGAEPEPASPEGWGTGMLKDIVAHGVVEAGLRAVAFWFIDS